MASVNRKAGGDEMAHAADVIRAAFPDCEPVFGGYSAYGGHHAPRDHTLSFRLRGQWGKYRSNVVWVLPDHLALLTVAKVHKLVANANGTGRRRRK